MPCNICGNKNQKRKLCDGCSSDFSYCSQCDTRCPYCVGVIDASKKQKTSVDYTSNFPPARANYGESSFHQDSSSGYGGNSKDDYQDEDDDYQDEDDDFQDEDESNWRNQLTHGAARLSEDESSALPAIPSYSVLTNNNLEQTTTEIKVCPNGVGSSHHSTSNTVSSAGLEIGVATWNINHLSNLVESKKKLSDEDKIRRDKTVNKIATVKDVFVRFKWLDVLVLQEINQHSPPILDKTDETLAYYSGPLMKSITKGKPPRNQKKSTYFQANYEKELSWVKPGQGEYYGIVVSKNSKATYDKCEVFYDGKLEEMVKDRVYYWTKKFDTGTADDEVNEGNEDVTDAETEEEANKSTEKAQADLAGKDISELQHFRPIIVHSIIIGDKTVKIAVVHTSPKGKNFHRKSVYGQVKGFLDFVSERVREYWIIGGDYYLEPMATVSNDSNAYAFSEVGHQRMEAEDDDKYEEYKQKTAANKNAPFKPRAQNPGESVERYQQYKRGAINRKNTPVKYREQKKQETDEEYEQRKRKHAQEIQRKKMMKEKYLAGNGGLFLEKQFKDMIGNNLKIAISISATNQGSLTRDAVAKIERDPNLFWGFYTSYWKGDELKYVNNSRADFFICTNNFGFTYTGLLSPEGRKLLVFDPDHNALNWWLDISDHTPVGGVFSINNQSAKWTKIKEDLFDEQHKKSVDVAINEIRSKAFNKFLDALSLLESNITPLMYLSEEELAVKEEELKAFPDERNLTFLFMGAFQRLLYTFCQIPQQQFPATLAQWQCPLSPEQITKNLQNVAIQVGLENLDKFERRCLENKSPLHIMRLFIKKAVSALQTLSVKFTEEFSRDDIHGERQGNFSIHDFEDVVETEKSPWG